MAQHNVSQKMLIEQEFAQINVIHCSLWFLCNHGANMNQWFLVINYLDS